MSPLALAVLFLVFAPRAADDDFPKVSPFEAVRFQDEDRPDVMVGGVWYELIAIDGVNTAEIIAFCRSRYDRRWRKRFEEDLVEVLHGMDAEPAGTADLELVRCDDGNRVELDEVLMTEANRRSLWEAGREREQRGRRSAPPATLTMAQAQADLEALRQAMEERFSYWERLSVDSDRVFREAEKQLKGSLPRAEFVRLVAGILATYGDGHSRVREYFYPPGYAPFLLGEAAAGVVAFQPDRDEFVDAARPYVQQIDGVPIEKWLTRVAEDLTQGAPQFQRNQALRALREIVHWRHVMGIKPADEIRLTLVNAQGASRKVVKVPVSRKRPTYGEWPRTGSRRLDGNVGYLRVPLMNGDEPFLADLVQQMEAFRDTRGLVIDVRGNGGGSRDALRTLLPYLLQPSDAPSVVNVAACRLPVGADPANPDGYLNNRYLYPAAWPGWSDGERAVIDAFAADFEPPWQLPAGKFSDWHYFVVSPPGDATTYFYDRPVVVLQNSGCFSATDIFLGAFRGRRNVTLMGTASGGGSGRSRGVDLPHSRLELRLSSMASFQSTGELYDGNGIPPDLVVLPDAGYFLGQSDPVLAAAVALLAEG